jgi:hypothetical protein
MGTAVLHIAVTAVAAVCVGTSAGYISLYFGVFAVRSTVGERAEPTFTHTHTHTHTHTTHTHKHTHTHAPTNTPTHTHTHTHTHIYIHSYI